MRAVELELMLTSKLRHDVTGMTNTDMLRQQHGRIRLHLAPSSLFPTA